MSLKWYYNNKKESSAAKKHWEKTKMKENIFNKTLELNKIYRIDTEKHNLPVYGRLIEFDGEYILLQKRNNAKVCLHTSIVLSVEPMKEPTQE